MCDSAFLIKTNTITSLALDSYLEMFTEPSIIATLKVKFQGRFFALRAIFSTLISSACESFVFAYIAFSGRIPNMELVEMVILLTLIKVAYEILIMPFTLKFTNFLKRSEGVNIFEKPSWRAFIPFLIK